VYCGKSTEDGGREVVFVHYRHAVESKKRKYREGRKGLKVWWVPGGAGSVLC
jgi:hypothetical protein